MILAADPAPKLSDYKLFDNPAATAPAAGVVRYDLVNPLFSDHASKYRYVYLPKGKTATYKADTVFDFPVGAVLVKTFAFAPDMRDPALDEHFVETRLLIHKQEGWVAYPYIWNAEQTEAIYSPIGGRKQIETIGEDGAKLSINYSIPNRNQCKECHQSAGVFQPIGPKARNLNHVGPAGHNQLEDWTARGILAGAPAPDAAPKAPLAFDVNADLGQRARAYLDINCAHCHKADGGASNSGLFLGWNETSPRGWGVHKRPTAAGKASGNNFYVIEPGHPEQSIMVSRMEATEPGMRMPELSRSTVDPKGVALIREWIAGLKPE
ncbi:MAG: SO2930 family diheme c-type cytochrome [Alphaproteobacteria bacterium]